MTPLRTLGSVKRAGRWLAVAIGVLAGLVGLPSRAQAQAFRAAAQAGVTSGATSLVISKPSGTVEGDVMIAAVAVRPNTATITAPSGWTLIRRTNNTNATANSQATYRKVAGSSEPSSYTWTLGSSPTGGAGGIMTFYGVNTASVVDVETGQTTANALTHAAPSVTTTESYDMVVTAHSFSSSATWTAPSGMTEGVDVASNATPNAVGIALEMNYVVQASAGATGSKTATASNDSDVGVAQTVALARATTATWTGAASNLWSNGGNWSGLGGTPIAGGEDLVFPSGASNLSNSNDLAAGTGFNSITISGTGYTLAGNSVALGAGNLSDGSSAGANTVSAPLSFSATRTVSVTTSTTTLTISGVISGAGGLTKSGSGVLALSGANSYTGTTTVSAGVLSARHNTALGTAAGTTSVTSGAALQVDGSGLTIAELLTVNGTGISGTGVLRHLANSNTWSGALTLGSASTITSDAGTLTLTGGVVSGASTLTLNGGGDFVFGSAAIAGSRAVTKSGAGTVTFNFANTYTGGTNINVGVLRLGVANGIGSTSTVTVASGATFDLNGFGDVVGSLAGAGLVTSGAAGAVTLSAGSDNSSTTFSGVIEDGSGAVALTKAGTGT
ncbi:MAG TPA: autotransporter-associated beta strand repeat-containing protein, partial [Gemmatimonadales bacterium]|nr:autotransporter-associated beta strand repeat-containing protein [Gemmatimonadales bacterium]